MGRPRVQHHCIDCGKPCPQRGRRNGGFRCIDCGVARHVTATLQIKAREGEYYEKWARAIAQAAERALRRIDVQHGYLDHDIDP